MDLQIFLLGQGIMFAWMTGLWLVQRAKNDAGVIDVGWTGGIGFMAILLASGLDGYPPRKWLVAALASLWSARLCYYILFHRVIGHREDSRYAKLRQHWGDRAQFYFLIVFLSQAVLIVIFAVPLWVVMKNPASVLTRWDALGAIIWFVAVAGESAADRQLAAFRANPTHHGKTCRSGLWRYSRHPNYFFEWVHWWAYVVMAIGVPNGAWTLLGPVLMGLFLFKITGIPYTEKQALASRGEDYRDYQRTTSLFVPWFPKS